MGKNDTDTSLVGKLANNAMAPYVRYNDSGNLAIATTNMERTDTPLSVIPQVWRWNRVPENGTIGDLLGDIPRTKLTNLRTFPVIRQEWRVLWESASLAKKLKLVNDKVPIFKFNDLSLRASPVPE